MKRIFLFVIFFTAVALNAQTKVNVSNFDKVSAGGSLKVKLVLSDHQGVEYKMISGEASDLEIKVVSGQLRMNTGNSYFWKKRTKAEIVVYHTGLSGVKASAGSSVKSDDVLRAQNMEVGSSSGAYLDVIVDAKTLTADCSSGGTLNLRGKSQNASLEVSSGGSLDADAHKSMEAVARSSSGGSLSIQVTEGLNAHASSGGSIRYTGMTSTGKLESKTSSGGSVSRMK